MANNRRSQAAVMAPHGPLGVKDRSDWVGHHSNWRIGSAAAGAVAQYHQLARRAARSGNLHGGWRISADLEGP